MEEKLVYSGAKPPPPSIPYTPLSSRPHHYATYLQPETISREGEKERRKNKKKKKKKTTETTEEKKQPLNSRRQQQFRKNKKTKKKKAREKDKKEIGIKKEKHGT
jgi:hypothetical protein